MGYQCINVDINGILVGIVGIIYIYICIHGIFSCDITLL